MTRGQVTRVASGALVGWVTLSIVTCGGVTEEDPLASGTPAGGAPAAPEAGPYEPVGVDADGGWTQDASRDVTIVPLYPDGGPIIIVPDASDVDAVSDVDVPDVVEVPLSEEPLQLCSSVVCWCRPGGRCHIACDPPDLSCSGLCEDSECRLVCDAGACPLTCVGGECELACVGGCEMDCEDRAVCRAECPEGGCGGTCVGSECHIDQSDSGGGTLGCYGGSDCRMDCQGGCDQICDDQSTCVGTCTQGGCGMSCTNHSHCAMVSCLAGCDLECYSGSVCHVATCDEGYCRMTCTTGATCTIEDCAGGGCEIDCQPGATCSIGACPTGDCVCDGCQ